MTQPPPYQPPYQQAPGGHPPQQPAGQYPPAYQGQPQGHQQPYGQGPQQYQAPPAQQPPYQGQPQGYQPQPGAQPYPAQQGTFQQYEPGVTCRVCGSGPAAKVTFRGVVGAVIMHTMWTANGPFCRDCGLSTFRAQTAKTLGGGCFSVGALILSPIFLLLNVIGRGKVANLPAPQRQVAGQAPAPLDPGPPVFSRPTAYVYPIVAFGLLMLIIIGNLAR